MTRKGLRAAVHSRERSVPVRVEKGIIVGMRSLLRLLATAFLLVAIAQACEFKVEPGAMPRYYRNDGWKLPDVDQWTFSAPAAFSGPGSVEATLKFGPGMVPGLTSRMLVGHSSQSDPYVFEIPRQEFEQEGKQLVMSSQDTEIRGFVWRYDRDNSVVAYTIGLAPVEAHRVNGHWKLSGELACIFYATFIDDKGDGVFRLLVPGWMTPDLIPEWAMKKDPA